MNSVASSSFVTVRYVSENVLNAEGKEGGWGKRKEKKDGVKG